jgi:hypothetical protein
MKKFGRIDSWWFDLKHETILFDIDPTASLNATLSKVFKINFKKINDFVWPKLRQIRGF